MAPIGQHIQKIRLLNGLTQEQLAKKAGVTYVTLIKIESGAIGNPTIGTVAKLATALSVSIDELYIAYTGKNGLANLVQQYKSLVDNSPDIVARFDSKLRCTYINPAGVKFSGKSKNDMLGKTPLEAGWLPKEVAEPFQEALRKVFKTERESNINLKLETPKGSFYFKNHLIPEFGKHNGVESVLNFAHPLKRGDEETKKKK